MGNFSRNTFVPAKRYVGVRLQQGVPLVDADWNELNDVVRTELYDSLGLGLTDGVAGGTSSFRVVPSIAPISGDFTVRAGAGLVGGRLVKTDADTLYSTQPVRAGGSPFPTVPAVTGPRTDLVYLDTWEREVDSVEDPSLKNPVIGIETCVRLKREVAFRVVVAGAPLPAPPVGHIFLPLALLVRNFVFPTGPAGTAVTDLRPAIRVRNATTQVLSVPPLFAATAGTAWNIDDAGFSVRKPGERAARGILPVTLPNGAVLTTLRVQGTNDAPFLAIQPDNGRLDVALFRRLLTGTLAQQIATVQIPGGTGAFSQSDTGFPAGTEVIDTNTFAYFLTAKSTQVGGTGSETVQVTGVRLEYVLV